LWDQLSSIAKGQTPEIVCNTPFDRFTGLRGARRLSARTGATAPASVLKEALVEAYSIRTGMRGRIRSILAYCGYDWHVEIRPKGVDENRLRFVEQEAFHYRLGDSVKQIVSAAEVALRMEPHGHYGYDLDGQHSKNVLSDYSIDLLRWENVYRRARFIKSVELSLVRQYDGRVIPFKDGSSGELSLIATLTFLSQRAAEKGVIIIDEPENSLHPAWQRAYLERILAITSLWRPHIFIATHSPLIVSGALNLQDIDVGVFSLSDSKIKLLSHEEYGLEETMWNLFDTITPVSHFLSQELVRIVDKVKRGTSSVEGAYADIKKLEEASYSSEQGELFEAARKLISDIVQGSW
jgi:hypothetical protein